MESLGNSLDSSPEQSTPAYTAYDSNLSEPLQRLKRGERRPFSVISATRGYTICYTARAPIHSLGARPHLQTPTTLPPPPASIPPLAR